MSHFVLVPGACHGGWWYEPLVAALEGNGHQASAVTLAGLGTEDAQLAGRVTLDDHVEQALQVAATAATNTERLVLVGHSYGGSVISGVADRLAGSVAALVYLDAFVPEDGDSCFAMTNDEQRRWYIEGAGGTGLVVEPLPFFDARARPHPLATFVQRSRLTGAWQSVAAKHYVAATDWPGISPFAAITERVRAEPGWTVHQWATRHNVMHDGHERVLDLLLDVSDSLA